MVWNKSLYYNYSTVKQFRFTLSDEEDEEEINAGLSVTVWMLYACVSNLLRTIPVDFISGRMPVGLAFLNGISGICCEIEIKLVTICSQALRG